MKTRNISALLICAILAACGGGGGGSSATPQQPAQTGQSLVKFTFKVPVKTKQLRRAKFIGGKYVSPATLGLGLSFSTTTLTPSQITTPNFALDLSVCLPTAFSTCVTNADGSETFTLQAPVPAGNYTFELATWDCSPTSGSFAGAQLSSAVVPLVVTAGGAPQSPSFVLNGIPASIAFMPAPSQSHVMQTTTGIMIIGNSTQQFIFNVLDADGFVITGNGAPTLSMSDSTGSFALTQNAANPNMWALKALAPAMANASGVTVSLAATSPAGSGIATLNAQRILTPQPEFWISASLFGVDGRSVTVAPANAVPVAIGNGLDIPVVPSPPPSAIVADVDGNLFVAQTPYIQEYTAAHALLPPTFNPSFIALPNGALAQPSGLALDANDLIWVTDSYAGGGVSVYNPNGTLSSPIASRPMSGAISIGIAPNATAVPASLRGSAWVINSSGLDVLTLSGSTIVDSYPGVLSGTLNAVGVGGDGTVWVYDGTNLAAFTMSATTGINTPAVATLAVSGGVGTQIAIDPLNQAWMCNSSTSYATIYALSGATITSTNSSVYGPCFGLYFAP